MYQIDFDELVKQLIQFERIRKPKLIALIRSYIEVFKVIWDDIITFRSAQRVELGYDCQVGLMELMLNRYFAINYSLATRSADIVNKVIISIDNTYFTLPNKYIYRKKDQVNGRFIYRNSDYQDAFSILRDEDYKNQYDFIVKCPSTVVLDEAGLKEVQQLVNKVNKGRMNYKVVNY